MSQSTRTRCMMHQKRQHQPRKPRQRKPRQRSLRRKSQLLRKPLQKSQPPRNKQPNWLVNMRKGQALISSLHLTEIIRAARFGGPFCCLCLMAHVPRTVSCGQGFVRGGFDRVGASICLDQVQFPEIDWRSCRFFFKIGKNRQGFLIFCLNRFCRCPYNREKIVGNGIGLIADLQMLFLVNA